MSSKILDEVLASLHVLSLPMKVKFRGIESREIALFKGPFGWGEFSPFLEYDEVESLPWLMSGIEAAFAPAITTIRKSISINATLPEIDSKLRIAEILSWYPGCQTVKIKVGNDLDRDLARVEIVRSINPTAKIRLDVNGSWEVEYAKSALSAIFEITEEFFEYVEQPCQSLAELRKLKNEINIPIKIAGDEVFRKVNDPFSIDVSGAIDVMILKAAPLGGIRRSLALAAHHGLPVVISSALESAVGIAHELQLAAALPELSYDSGLGTGALFVGDVGFHQINNGQIAMEPLIPNLAALSKFAALPERKTWWQDRIRKTWASGADAWISSERWEP
ncbi:MAG: o-succinylbenzoate synthase [Acidobacteria bacterium]|nr:o-succinylbenzoate synthase [Acidobacteriota bacterium]